MVKKQHKINKIAKQLVANLETKGVNVSKLILFGSYAKGEQKMYSDIDIAIISRTFNGKSILRRQELLAEAIFPIKEPIEAIGYTPKESRSADKLSFLSEIITSGKIIYQKS